MEVRCLLLALVLVSILQGVELKPLTDREIVKVLNDVLQDYSRTLEVPETDVVKLNVKDSGTFSTNHYNYAKGPVTSSDARVAAAHGPDDPRIFNVIKDQPVASDNRKVYPFQTIRGDFEESNLTKTSGYHTNQGESYTNTTTIITRPSYPTRTTKNTTTQYNTQNVTLRNAPISSTPLRFITTQSATQENRSMISRPTTSRQNTSLPITSHPTTLHPTISRPATSRPSTSLPTTTTKSTTGLKSVGQKLKEVIMKCKTSITSDGDEKTVVVNINIY